MQSRRATAVVLLLAVLAGCGGGGAPPPTTAPAPPAAAPPASSLAAAGTAAESAPAQASLAPLSPPVTVKVGSTGALTEAGQIIALQKGYFQELGLEIEYQQFDSAARMIPLLTAGQLDVGAGSASAGLWNAVSRGVALKIVGPQARQHDDACAFWFAIQQDVLDSGQVREFADFKDKKIVGPCEDCIADFILDATLKTAGLGLPDVDVSVMSFADMTVALSNHAVDIALLPEAQATIAESRGFATRWKCTAAARPGYQSTVILYAAAFADGQSDVARRWMVAYLKGLHDYTDAIFRNRNREEIVQTLIAGTTVKDPALYQKMGWAWLDPNGEVSRTSLQEQLDWLRARGKIQGDVQEKDVTDLSFAQFAQQQIGRYDTTGLVR